MKLYYYIAFLLFCWSCNVAIGEKQAAVTPKVGTVTMAANIPVNGSDTIAFSEYLTCYMVIADTGASYDILSDKMFALNKSTGIGIDTMDRTFNRQKGYITLPDSSDDGLYAGEYFPRRDISEVLSIEQLGSYMPPFDDNPTMALVSGIYESRGAADSSLVRIQKIAKSAFVLKADIYMGCMH